MYYPLIGTSLCYCILHCTIGGFIPSELCSSTGISISVADTDIRCYSGCLTSSKVVIAGATDECHNGSIMERFLLISGTLLVLGVGCGVYYAFYNDATYSWVSQKWNHCCVCFTLSDGDAG